MFNFIILCTHWADPDWREMSKYRHSTANKSAINILNFALTNHEIHFWTSWCEWWTEKITNRKMTSSIDFIIIRSSFERWLFLFRYFLSSVSETRFKLPSSKIVTGFFSFIQHFIWYNGKNAIPILNESSPLKSRNEFQTIDKADKAVFHCIQKPYFNGIQHLKYWWKLFVSGALIWIEILDKLIDGFCSLLLRCPLNWVWHDNQMSNRMKYVQRFHFNKLHCNIIIIMMDMNWRIIMTYIMRVLLFDDTFTLVLLPLFPGTCQKLTEITRDVDWRRKFNLMIK